LQLMPFFLYLKQHLFLGLIQFNEQLLLQTDDVFVIFIIGFSKL